jgi:uncharacterized damage-inducible protein DinB
MKQEIFKLAAHVRSNTLRTLDSITEESADQMPPGFRNTIRWHLGHIYLTQEWLVFYHGNERASIPETFPALFAPGTNPAEWKTEPPTLKSLRSLLSEQPSRISKTFAGRLDEIAKKPFKTGDQLELTTVGGILAFTLQHEGLHYGFMNALTRAIAANGSA